MGQIFLTVGAMALLSMAIISMNNGFTSNSDVITDSKLGVTAVSLASSIIEEAQGKAFDKATDNDVVTVTTLLTPAANLGKDPGEFYPDSLNDFDDYNNLHITQSFYHGGTFNIDCAVQYVNPSNPDVAASTPTFHKKLTVKVSSPSMADTVKQSYIFSYWYFR